MPAFTTTDIESKIAKAEANRVDRHVRGTLVAFVHVQHERHNRPLSITKASVCSGGLSGKGQRWAIHDIEALARHGLIQLESRGKSRFVRLRDVEMESMLAWAVTNEESNDYAKCAKAWVEFDFQN